MPADVRSHLLPVPLFYAFVHIVAVDVCLPSLALLQVLLEPAQQPMHWFHIPVH